MAHGTVNCKPCAVNFAYRGGYIKHLGKSIRPHISLKYISMKKGQKQEKYQFSYWHKSK